MIDLGAVSDVTYHAIGALLCVVAAVLMLIHANEPATSDADKAARQKAFDDELGHRCMEYRQSVAVTQASMGELHRAGERLQGSIQRWTA